MKNNMNEKNAPARGGFTLLELMITIVVAGIIAGLVVISWNDFVRHQEIRADAGNVHKELLAAKARAIESGDTVRVVYSVGSSSLRIDYFIEDTNAVNGMRQVSKTVTMNERVKFAPPSDISAGSNGLPAADQNWSGTITIRNDHVKAYDDGWMLIRSAHSKTEFCIIKAANSIKPELYRRSGTGSWSKI